MHPNSFCLAEGETRRRVCVLRPAKSARTIGAENEMGRSVMGELGIRGGAIVFAALLWLTAQPLLPYAEPVLLCGTGMALGITIWMAMHAHENGAPVPRLAQVTGTIAGLLEDWSMERQTGCIVSPYLWQ